MATCLCRPHLRKFLRIIIITLPNEYYYYYYHYCCNVQDSLLNSQTQLTSDISRRNVRAPSFDPDALSRRNNNQLSKCSSLSQYILYTADTTNRTVSWPGVDSVVKTTDYTMHAIHKHSLVQHLQAVQSDAARLITGIH